MKKKRLPESNKGTEICSRLAQWRKKAGIPQSRASAMLGVPIRTYQNWEQLRRRPTGLSLTTLELFIKKVELRVA